MHAFKIAFRFNTTMDCTCARTLSSTVAASPTSHSRPRSSSSSLSTSLSLSCGMRCSLRTSLLWTRQPQTTTNNCNYLSAIMMPACRPSSSSSRTTGEAQPGFRSSAFRRWQRLSVCFEVITSNTRRFDVAPLPPHSWIGLRGSQHLLCLQT